MAEHAILSASSAHRWMNCTPSARIAACFPNQPSAFAEAGSLAHMIAELKAHRYFNQMSADEYRSNLQCLKADPAYDPGMDDATDMYLEHLKYLSINVCPNNPIVMLEQRVEFTDYVPGGFGTADCLMFGDNTLCVTDYKNGSGVAVSAESNEQMMLYALGALQSFKWLIGESIATCHLSIVQPHNGGVKEWDITTASLLSWGENILKPRAKLAWDGHGECNPGAWCTSGFCPARAMCSARINVMLGASDQVREFMASDYLVSSDDEIADILLRVRDIPALVKELENHLTNELLNGKSARGFKLVNGRSSREWKGGVDTAFDVLIKRGVENAMLYTQSPVSVAALEKNLGKATFKEVAADLVETHAGKPTLALDSDKRKAYTPEQINIAEAFASVTTS